jgi:hypothetical protein
LVKRGVEIDQIIFGDTHYLYNTPNKNFPRNKIFLFKLVNDDVKKFINENPFIDLPPQQPTQFYNLNYDERFGTITGTDLDHAYWRIAYVKGYISKNTYEHGIKDEKSKTIRLATLGVLGSEQKFERYENGEYIETITKRKENKAMKLVYRDIRLTCFFLMFQLSLLLGEDFESWNTDCIYYRDSAENRKLVHDFFDMHNMLFKQLTNNSMDYFEEVEDTIESNTNQEQQD